MQPPPGPRSAYTGTPAVPSALMSRYTVRSETSSRRARSAAVMRPRLCSNSSNESKRSARTAHLRDSGIAGSIARNPDRWCQVDAATLIQVMVNRRVTGRVTTRSHLYRVLGSFVMLYWQEADVCARQV